MPLALVIHLFTLISEVLDTVLYIATSKLYGTEQALKVIPEMRNADADSHELSNQLVQKQIHVKVKLFNLMLFEQDKDFHRVIAGPIPQRQREEVKVGGGMRRDTCWQ